MRKKFKQFFIQLCHDNWFDIVGVFREFVKERSRKRKHYITYLAGAIEDPEDHGIEWREKWAPVLRKMGIIVHDPCAEEKLKTGFGPEDSKKIYRGWKRSGNWDKFHEIMIRIQNMDIKLVRNSDFLIVLFEKETGGTICEIWDAFLHGIPIYMVCYGNKSDINSWVLNVILKNGEVFSNFNQLIIFLEQKLKDEGKLVK